MQRCSMEILGRCELGETTERSVDVVDVWGLLCNRNVPGVHTHTLTLSVCSCVGACLYIYICVNIFFKI